MDEGGDAPCWSQRVCDACGALVDLDTHVCLQPRQPIRRLIAGFHQDSCGDWVAELSCLHNQHVRHDPPFHARPWVLVEAERTARIGTAIDCGPCARAELPTGLAVARIAGPFDESTLPPGLRKSHMVADRTWACVHVVEGTVGFTMLTEPVTAVALSAGDQQTIPPGIAHALTLEGPVVLTVEFLTAGREASGPRLSRTPLPTDP